MSALAPSNDEAGHPADMDGTPNKGSSMGYQTAPDGGRHYHNIASEDIRVNVCTNTGRTGFAFPRHPPASSPRFFRL